MKDLYELLRNIGIMLSVIGISITGFKMFIGGEKESQGAPRTLLIIFISVFSLLALPTVVSFAKRLFETNMWRPK